VKLEVIGTPNTAKKTTAVSDSKNPVWNQAFTFLVPDGLGDREYLLGTHIFLLAKRALWDRVCNRLVIETTPVAYVFSPTYFESLIFYFYKNSLTDIHLMDENIFVDEKLGRSTINLNALNLVNGEVRPIQASFGNVRIKQNVST
jgi:C2 domain